MNRSYKWIGVLAAITLFFLTISGMAALKGSKEIVSGDEFQSVQNDSTTYREGERLAKMWGCYGGCHAGATANDKNMGPQLTGIIANYSEAELKTVLQEGKRPNGTEVTSMPAPMFRFLDDQDIDAIYTFLKQVSQKGQ